MGPKENASFVFFSSLAHLWLISLTAALQASCIPCLGVQGLIFPGHCQVLECPWVLSSFPRSCSMRFHREWLPGCSHFFAYALYTFSVIRDPAFADNSG